VKAAVGVAIDDLQGAEHGDGLIVPFVLGHIGKAPLQHQGAAGQGQHTGRQAEDQNESQNFLSQGKNSSIPS
jgi:hypothetical protein